MPDNLGITPIGPRSGVHDQVWCCGLNCGNPCPYGLKIEPLGATRDRPAKFTGTEWCKTCGWVEDCVCGFYDLDAVNAHRADHSLPPLTGGSGA
jgi:hypothetical protein